MVRLTQINFNADPKDQIGQIYELLSATVRDLNNLTVIVEDLTNSVNDNLESIKLIAKNIQ